VTSAFSAIPSAQQKRGTLFVENALLMQKNSYAGEQYILRLNAPKCARNAVAGSFVHIQCNERIAMRRPLSIMRSNAAEGWIEVLFKVVGDGLRGLSEAEKGISLSTIGPIGKGFEAHIDKPRALLIGGGVGIPPMIFLAEQRLREDRSWQPQVLMGSEIPYPFTLTSSSLPTEWLSGEIVSTMPLLEDWGVTTRLASLSGFAGCYHGYVTELARLYLEQLTPEHRLQTEIFSCGPTPMLEAVAALAEEYRLPCQVSLEEFMACGVGGCAGCTVEVQTPDGPAMKRVCVDGPVFDAATVF